MAVEYIATVNGTDYGFDFIDQEIEIEDGVSNVLADDLKEAIREAEAHYIGMAFGDIMSPSGDPVTLDPGQGIATDQSVILLEGWRVLSLSTTGTFTLGGGNVVNVITGIDVLGQNTLVTSINNVSQAGTRIEVGSGVLPTDVTDIKNAIFDEVMETGFDFRDFQMILAAAMAGKVSGAGTTDMLFRDITDTKDRITATVDESGNRTSITFDLT